eukprot:XP_022271023.1 uncharacterized protein LOC111094490 [Canis lupus familiaris]
MFPRHRKRPVGAATGGSGAGPSSPTSGAGARDGDRREDGRAGTCTCRRSSREGLRGGGGGGSRGSRAPLRLCAALADGAASGCRSRGPAGGVRDEDGEGAPRPRAAADPHREAATPRPSSARSPSPATNAFRGSNRKTNRAPWVRGGPCPGPGRPAVPTPASSRLPKLGQSRRSKNIFGRSDLMNDSTTIDNVMNTESG